MSQVALVSTDLHVEELLRSSGLHVARVGWESWVDHVHRHQSAALVLDVRGQGQLPPELAAYRRKHADTPIVLIASALEPRLMLDALRAGVNECVAEPLTAATLAEPIRHLLAQATGEPRGQLFAMVGAKGGVGTTTLAVNAAAVLARITDGDVLLVDLHIGHGDAAVFLGVEPRFSVVDALENVHRVDEALFRSLVEQTRAHVDLLSSSDRGLPVAVEPERTRALLEFAARRYRLTFLDVPRSDMATLDALDAVTAIVVVTSQDIGALRGAARLAHGLRHRYGGSRVKIAVNRFDARAEIGQADVERVVGGSIAHMIPSDYRAALEALNAGRPLATDKDRRLARALHTFAVELAGVVTQPPERSSPGVLGRLAWRRA